MCPSGARRGGAYDGGRELAGSVGQDAERQETRDNARRPLRDGNFQSKNSLNHTSVGDLIRRMNNEKGIDFLTRPSTNHIRKEIQNICDSYSHSWDVLAELCQNAVDAISLHKKRHGESKNHKIDISVNVLERSIEITDTGIGFPLDKFSELLAPHGTDKSPADPVIGQKGVGLTYTIFISNYYMVETKSVTGYLKGEIKNSLIWKNGASEVVPIFEYTDKQVTQNEPADTFTRVLVKDLEKSFEESDDLFSQSFDVIKFLLRTRTAIGFLKTCFGEKSELGAEVTLTMTGADGKKVIENIPPHYLLPEDMITKNRLVDLDDFKKQAATLDDNQKAKRLQGKCLKIAGSVIRANRRINYYCFFAPSRHLWSDISEKNGLTIKTTSGDVVNLYEGGIYTASRGMPTGIRLEAPRTGYFGYWPNFYIILEDDSIVFDLGRKSIPGRTMGLLRDIAKERFNDFNPFFEYVSSDPPAISVPAIQQHEKSKLIEQLKSLADLKCPSIAYLKHPDSQEAAVVALFHELLGAKVLEGYFTLKTGYKMTYDLWGLYRISKSKIAPQYSKLANAVGVVEVPVVIEFKYKCEDILIDFDSNRKNFTDIDLLVCWDLDEAAFAKYGVAVEVLSPDDVFFYGSNFQLIWPGSYNLGTASQKPVLSLRKFIQDLTSK